MARWIRALLAVGLLACVVFAIMAAKSAPPRPTVPGSSIQVKVNGTFSVVLESNPSTGFTWVPKIDGQPFEPVDEEYKEGSNLLGSPGVQVFRIKALEAGTFNLRFSYERSWESQPANQAGFTVIVK